MTFVVRVSLNNPVTSARAVSVNATLNFGGASGLSTNGSATRTVSGSNYIDFLVTISTAVATQTVSITATVNGREEISTRVLNAGPSSALNVNIKAQAALSIQSFTWTNGTGSYVGGMKFVVRITLANPAILAKAQGVTVSLSYGGYSGLSTNVSASKTISGTGYIDLLVTIATMVTSQNPVSIIASATGIEEISLRSLNAASTPLNVEIKARASLTIQSLSWQTGNGTYVAGTTFVVRVTLANPATAAAAQGVTVSLSYGGYSGLSTNASASKTISGTGYIDLLVTIAAGAASQNPVSISASATGTEEISLRALSATSGSPLNVRIKAQATLTVQGLSWQTGNGTYVGGMTFVVRITLANPATSAKAEGVTVSLSFGGYSGLSTNASASKTVSGTASIDLLVTAATSATSQNPVIITASFTGTEEISLRPLSGVSGTGLNIAIQQRAIVAITGITYRTGTGTYVGGMTFVVRVTFSNTGGTSANGVSATLTYGSYVSLSSNASSSIGISAGATRSIDFLITVATNAMTAAVVINATWTGTEAISLRAISGDAGGNTRLVNIQSQASVTITSINYLTGSGTYVGGMTFDVRVSFRNNGGTLATSITATLGFGGYGSLSTNASNTISIAAGATGYLDFQISVAALATSALVTISATWTGTEAISMRALNGNSGSNTLNVNIQSQTLVQFVKIFDLYGGSTPEYVAGMNFTMRVEFTNRFGGTDAINFTVYLNFFGNSFLTTNASAPVTIAAGQNSSYIDFLVYISSTATNSFVYIGASWTGQEAISFRPFNGKVDQIGIVAAAIIKARAAPSIVGINFLTGIGTYIGGMTFTVSVAYSNIGGVTANDMMAVLSFGGYPFLSVVSTPPAISVPIGGTIYYQNFDVLVSTSATTAAVTISATWTGSERISNRPISGDSGTNNLNVQIKARASVSITSMTHTSGNGTYVGGMTFTMRVALQNTGGATANTLTVALNFGSYASYVSSNTSASIVLPAGETRYINFLITVATNAPTRNPLTINATFAGVEEISSRSFSGSSGAVFLNVAIQSRAQITIRPVTIDAPQNKSRPALWVTTTIQINNLGGTSVIAGNASIFVNSTYATGITAITPTTGLTVPAGGFIIVQIRFYIAAATPNNTKILISGNFAGIEAISGAARTPTYTASCVLTVGIMPLVMTLSILDGRTNYVQGDEFTVRVTIDNVLGTTNVTDGILSLVCIGNIPGYSIVGGYTGLVIINGSAISRDFLVIIAGNATLGVVSFRATFSYNNPLPRSMNSAPISITTQTRASVSILSITYLTGNGTYVAGMSFRIRVTYRNTGGTAAINLTTTLHFGSSSIYTWNATGLITVLAGSTGTQDFEITVLDSALATLDSVNASWAAVEQYSLRALGGGSGGISLPIRILARANVSITNITISAPNGFFVGASFTVNISITNTGGAKGMAISCLLLPSIPGYLTWSSPSAITVNGGTTRYIIFTVYVSNNNVTLALTANFTGTEEISGRQLGGPSGIFRFITIPPPAFVFIANMTIISPNKNATFTAGETFTVRIWFQNTGGLDATIMTVNLVFEGYSYARGTWTGALVVGANNASYIDLVVTISDVGTTQNVTGSVTWSGRENNSNRAISGTSGTHDIEVHIIAIRKPNFFTAFLLVCGIAGVVLLGMMATRPKKIKEQIVPGKKKTCKQCGKYVKPYASTCPYCGYKLAEEETLADAMNKLSHLFIFHEESGVCLYYHSFTETKIDPQLISGFLSAITSFGGQFEDATAKKKAGAAATTAKKASDLKELVYKEYRILMESSGPCKFAVLITGQTSKILSFKISQFIKHFMRTYEEALKDWKGNVRIFKDVEKMVRLIFGLTKVQPEGAKPAALPGKPAADEGATSATGPKAPPPGHGAVPPQKPVKPVGPAPIKPSLPPSGQISPPAVPPVQKPAPPSPQVQPGQQPTSAAASLFALKEQIGAPGEFTPAAPKEPAKPPSRPLGFSLPGTEAEDKKDKKKGKK
ncbi:MAG: hypothetical protein Q6373_023335 [Candidatus Sigynarchaeota archaeon]